MNVKLKNILSRDEFRALSQINDRVAIAHMSARIFLNFALASVLSYSLGEQLCVLAILSWVAYSIQFHFWGYAGIGHELLHERVFMSKKANNFLYEVCSALTWNNAAMFKDSHMLHHRATFSMHDVESKSVQGWGPTDILGYLLVDLRSMFRRIYYTLINTFGYYPDLSRLDPRYAFSARVTLVFNVNLYLLIYGLTSAAFLTLLLALSPFSCSLLNKILAKAQHHGLEQHGEDSSLKFSRTLKLPQALRFLYANMNYHAEHHFAPSVPYYRLPELHETLKSKGLVASQSLGDFLKNEFPSVWVSSSR
jgi:fatty acid desaturase